MFRKWLLPSLAAIGLLCGLFLIAKGNVPPPAAQPVVEPAVAPFSSYVSGAGIVEASSRNIAIGTPVAALAKAVFVVVGDRVRQGVPLFQLDDRDIVAELVVRKAALQAAKAKLAEQKATLAQDRDQLERAQKLKDPRALSTEDLAKRWHAVQIDEAKLQTAVTEVSSAEAELAETRMKLDRLAVRAPIDGEILQVNVRPGEFAQVGELSTPLILMGNTELLYIRTDIDENDAWRVRSGAAAIAFVRGNRELQTPLTFVYCEPYIVPKKSLTGDSVERVDTRVLQVLFSFARGKLPVYVGQQMDVYIEAPPLAVPTEKTPSPGKAALAQTSARQVNGRPS